MVKLKRRSKNILLMAVLNGFLTALLSHRKKCQMAIISIIWLLMASGAVAARRPVVLVADYDGAITPASADWLISAIRKANQDQDSALVIELDTPGGLLESTRVLVKEIEASSVPVIIYVSPAGARAASAGTFITMAGHVAAMAPGTHIGAAHPVEMGKETQGDMRAKIENDTVAFIKTIALARHRNAVWAEYAVRESSSVTEQEALTLNVIDLVARDLDKLLESIQGRKVITAGGEMVLQTKGAELNFFPMSLSVKILRTLADPNIAYLLMMLGTYGMIYELINPGAILPGVLGSISLILGLYAFHTLPVNYAGVALIGLGILLFVLESQTGHGLLGLGGVISLALGSLMLIQGDFPYLQISRILITGILLLSALLLFFLVAIVLKLKRRRAVSGAESMVGQIGTAKTVLNPTGQVLYSGEYWNAESKERIESGEEVEITGVEKLKLLVKKRREKNVQDLK